MSDLGKELVMISNFDPVLSAEKLHNIVGNLIRGHVQGCIKSISQFLLGVETCMTFLRLCSES